MDSPHRAESRSYRSPEDRGRVAAVRDVDEPCAGACRVAAPNHTTVRQHVLVITDVSSPENLPLLAAAVRKFRGVEAGKGYAASPSAVAFVATEGPEIAGWCWGYHLPRPDAFSMLYLHDLEVDEPYRRQGVGRRLVEAFMGAGRRSGASKMFLTTSEVNMPARRLYEALGGGAAAQGPTVNCWFLP